MMANVSIMTIPAELQTYLDVGNSRVLPPGSMVPTSLPKRPGSSA